MIALKSDLRNDCILKLLNDPTIPFLCIYPDKTITQIDMCKRFLVTQQVESGIVTVLAWVAAVARV